MKIRKRYIRSFVIALLLISSAITFSLHSFAIGGGGDDDTGGLNYIKFYSASKTMSLTTSLSVGSTADNRIRSIGWLVTITLPNGQTASAVFESNGSNGTTNGYSWSYSYVIYQFTHDAGTAGENIVESFYNNTGGTIKMYAYFAWWKAGSSSDSKYNFNGPADGKAGAVSGYFADPSVNYTPSDVTFTKNPDSRFSGSPGTNGVAASYTQAAEIENIWGGNPSSLQDYYPAVGVLNGSDIKGSVGDSIVNRVYRVDTDVITSVTVKNDCTLDILGGAVTFTVDGVTQQSKTVPVPAGGSNLCWFKWHTPSTPGYVSIKATYSGGGFAQTSNEDNYIYSCDEATPPRPKPTDTKSGYQFVMPGSSGAAPSLSWGVWNYKITFITGVNADGSAYSIPITNWYYTTHYASLASSLTVTPDSHCPTAYQNGCGQWCMKSGYGIAEQVKTSVNTDSSSDVTAVQRVAGFYPEFEYGTYYRLFDAMSGGLFQLKTNKYSMYNSRCHFTPLWFPDGDYTAQSYCFDCWTPGGMLSCYSTDAIKISGSVFDDWHVFPE
jgi:hypothetical protein